MTANAEPEDDGTSSGDPVLLAGAAQGFMTLSNACGYLTSTEIIQQGASLEYLLMNLDTDKATLEADWQDMLHQVTGMLLAGEVQCADAAFDLKMLSENFNKADS
jgi:hypothetical protein